MVLMGKSSINGSFSMAMLNNQSVKPMLGHVGMDKNELYDIGVEFRRCFGRGG